MAEKKPATVQRTVIPQELKDRYILMTEKDYPVLMAEYTRLILENTQQTKAAVNSIKGWVTFFGLLLLLQIVITIFFSDISAMM